MSKKETTPQEVEATYLRLAKIYGSQLWRLSLLLLLIIIAVFAYGVIAYKIYKNVEVDQITSINNNYNFLLLLKYITTLLFLYLFTCVIFRLVIGLKYSDFSLSFVPHSDKHTPGFWPAIFYVGWAYSWRMGIVMVAHDLAEMTFPHFFEMSSVKIISFVVEMAIDLYLLRFVVNKQYGKVRLSLLKREVEA